jgi:hypothetical protein
VFCKEELKLSPPLSLVCALQQLCLEVLKHGGIHLMIESRNLYNMACEGHHPFIVQKYHINQHKVASQDTEISFEISFESGFLQNFGSLCWNNMTCRYN